jgi:hypothetical protein
MEAPDAARGARTERPLDEHAVDVKVEVARHEAERRVDRREQPELARAQHEIDSEQRLCRAAHAWT